MKLREILELVEIHTYESIWYALTTCNNMPFFDIFQFQINVQYCSISTIQ
jgi:hypothetical protein